MDVGSKVKMNTFNETLVSPEKCDSSEDYWSLVGSTGSITKPENSRGRFLVTFDIDVARLGLHCHNEVPNSLLILVSDLEIL
jgi:hypothetical protein